MTREMLRPRRPALSLTLAFSIAGNVERIPVPFGFNDDGRVREAFCLTFKAGTDLQTLMHHACIVISVALQHGAAMGELQRILGEEDESRPPRSLLGLIVRAGAMIDREMAEVATQPAEAT